MEVSVIIVSYNTKALLRQCLSSVFEKTQDVEFEVIVVDNASNDGSPQMVREEFPNVTLIESPENLGFGRANNLGAQYAGGEYLFLLNSDTVLMNNAAKILADFLNSNPKAGVCGGNLFDENKNPACSFVTLAELSVAGELLNLLCLQPKSASFNKKTHPISVGCIIGADFMVRSNVFKKTGGFDPDFFMYYEEMELTYRIKKAGYKSFNVPQAQIIHLGGKSLDSEQKFKLVQMSKNVYYRKTQSRFGFLACNGIFFLTILSRIMLFTVMRNEENVVLWKRMLVEFERPGLSSKRTDNE
ncbi:MAG: glycosyltransferase family 2 protein [Dysgonamonadaceae bacterium]|jgi:GT2 family glycosyltransferase|nr:glycosyltransferase family 2 protein [Dysgonamonadaceae bacterium]